ncbi:protein tyrosine phosphatase type IVA 3 isoform X4 [Cervus elaphus]|uniref:protein tyrosine phosphatase type IVA 3 isoform X4 n=1 Tax=Cervus canadensis TaxID=1574408 RepID=UPI001C9E9EE9|nr:protein tyrosine phosphatase type IVA 3 isoform X4 [Cervus canadensis]XP_043736460.1 protein tyrosine phosphatase type IVA 3 isoform X4 [Cervus elaphus]
MARMNRPAPVEVSYKNMRFLITHNPTNATLSSFIEDLKKYGATTVVRVCEVTYDKAPLEKDGITVVGSSPRGAGPHREWDEVRGRHPVHPTLLGEEESPEAIQPSPAVKGAPQCHLPQLPQPLQDSRHPRIFQDCPSEALAPGHSVPHSRPPWRSPNLLSLWGGGSCPPLPPGKEPRRSRVLGWQQGQWGGCRGPEPTPAPPS